MAVSLDECSGCSVLLVDGSLRTPIATELRERVAGLVGRGDRRIVVDLARVSEIDAAGVGELVRVRNMTANAGGVMQIANATGRIRQVLEATGLSGLLIDLSDSLGG